MIDPAEPLPGLSLEHHAATSETAEIGHGVIVDFVAAKERRRRRDLTCADCGTALSDVVAVVDHYANVCRSAR